MIGEWLPFSRKNVDEWGFPKKDHKLHSLSEDLAVVRKHMNSVTSWDTIGNHLDHLKAKGWVIEQDKRGRNNERYFHLSGKTLFHRDGIMVYEDENHELKPIHPIIADLQIKAEDLQEQIDQQEQLRKGDKKFDAALIKSNRKQIRQMQLRIKELVKSSQKLIDLTDQIITYQDTPPPNMISLIMSLLSQDSPKDQLYTFVEKRNGELIEKKNRLKGTPNLFYTQVIDDTDNQRYEEKNRRFIHITPDTSEEKIDSACELISDNLGLLDEEYEEDVVSEQDKERARHIVQVIIAKLKQHSKHFKPKKTGVRIPFQRAIEKSIPGDKRDVWRMTATSSKVDIT